ncbi:MAG: hypothetical protein FD166_376 [Bacteroidetes bacterium]|nr:MAG: hypothetical protein FD166_376 [Bacteroidota bacterium]
MIVYQSSKEGFLYDVMSNEIEIIVHKAFFEHLGRHTSANEVNSFKNSLGYMYRIMEDPGIPSDSRISIEFQIPLTSKRIDFIVSGLSEAQKEQVVIIELKQWSSAQLTQKDAVVKTLLNHTITETTHPSYQAWSYAALIEDFNETVRDNGISLIPCAYLHNYEPDNVITNNFYKEYTDKAPVFLRPDALKLREFIRKFIKFGDTRDILYKIENGRIRPSKNLGESLASMLKGNPEFIMIDDQKLVYETALEMASKADIGKKQVLIVEGGPGTGKSVVAVNLMVELTNRGLVTKLVSKNAAPREVYKTLLKGTLKRSSIDNLFGSTGTFYDVDENTFDNLIVDEAHRLNEKSGLYGNLGNNQALEIMNAAKFTIFFIDDDQRIHVKDIGTKKQLEKWARQKKATVKHLKLTSQFRCNGSDSYLAWLDQMLQIRETANFKLSVDEFDFQIYDNPNELFKTIKERNQSSKKARMVAGYCWDWISQKNPELKDVEIPMYNFGMTWNLKKDGSTWIIAENSINEIGCIHTCQGLELDYIGVIIGNDLKFKDGRIVTDVFERSGMDQSIKGLKSKLKQNPKEAISQIDSIIKNTYRTLMTRGMKGCYVYCCDSSLAEYLKSGLAGQTIENPESCDMSQIVQMYPRIEPEVNDDMKYIDFLPYYSIKAACGAFGEWQTVDVEGWVKADNIGTLSRGMFVIKAVGHSMAPRIKDGDLCIFRANVAGSRNNKIVLVQHNNHFDSENQGSYSIKQYTSQKIFDSESGSWMHEIIVLKPLNTAYDPILITEEDVFMVVGEFIGVVG